MAISPPAPLNLIKTNFGFIEANLLTGTLTSSVKLNAFLTDDAVHGDDGDGDDGDDDDIHLVQVGAKRSMGASASTVQSAAWAGGLELSHLPGDDQRH